MMRIQSICGVVLALLLPLTACASESSSATQQLRERNKMFESQIIRVADNVLVASGFQVTTTAMIVGDDGVIIIDPGIAIPLTQNARTAFRQATDKPVKAIIYTHGHPDHTNGARVYYADGVEVWARSNFGSESQLVIDNGYAGGVRKSNTQGFDLPDEQKIGIGIGIPPRVRPALGNTIMADGGQTPREGQVSGTVPPTNTFAGERQVLDIAGVHLELVRAPGETADQLYVWYPAKRVLFAGDNFYQSWPNTYPLRGTARRSVRNWIESLDKMVAEGPDVVVPGHTTPMSDATTVLGNYRDALQWVLDRTIEGAREGMTPDQLIAYTELPEHLAELDYLRDYYGSRWGTVRDIYAQDLGWFDGDVLNLHREAPYEKARRLADLLGGIDVLAEKALAALDDGDSLGAAQLARAWTVLQPEESTAWVLLADALAVIAENTFNAPARNYTFSSANRARARADALLRKQPGP